jgi:hypothetical protein
MLEEVFSKRNHLANNGTLIKELFYDIVHQTRLPAGISAVDADNCYNRIAHLIASMVFQALGVLKEGIIAMLTTIQDMKFFLRTGFGDSKDYAGSIGGKKTQGMCQGNGASPAAWTATSIAMINSHKRKGHGTHLVCPITKKPMHLVGTLFRDYTELVHLDMNKVETIKEAHTALQESIHNWGCILIATGGALKPEKCFYHLISFSWKQDRMWQYSPNKHYGPNRGRNVHSN